MGLIEEVDQLIKDLKAQGVDEKTIEQARDVRHSAHETQSELEDAREEEEKVNDLERNIHDLEEKLADAMPSPRTITEREKYQVFERMFIQLGLDQLLELEREAERKFEYRTDFAAWPAMEKMKDEE
jgi:hypothetical protein